MSDQIIKLDIHNAMDVNVHVDLHCLCCGRKLHRLQDKDVIDTPIIEAHFRQCICQRPLGRRRLNSFMQPFKIWPVILVLFLTPLMISCGENYDSATGVYKAIDDEWDKVKYAGHVYVRWRSDRSVSAVGGIAHDPECPCKKGK